MPQQPDSPQQKIDTLTRLIETGSQLNSTLPLETLLGNIMDVAAEITGSEAASVLLWDDNKQELQFAATTTDSPIDLIGKPVPVKGSIAGRIMREQRAVRVNDVKVDPQHYAKIEENDEFVTQSVLGVPMTAKDSLIGVLEVVNKQQLPWTDDDEQYLSALAAQAAVAIDGAQLVTALKKANDELSQLDALKNEFIAIASHELRTPLGIIMGYGSMLQQDENPETQKHATKVMNSALKLRKIIEDLTNLRYLQQNESELQLETMSVQQLLDDVRFDAKALFKANDQRLQIIPADETLQVRIDRARMAMAICNVVINAANFTPNNDRVLVETKQHGDDIWIQVIDNGIGIESDHLDRIFEQFYQVQDHMIRQYEGLGIGLSISRALTQAHGGRIWAESDGPSTGTTVTIALPLAKSEETA